MGEALKVALAFCFQNEAHWLKLHLPVILSTNAHDGIVAVDGGSTDGGADYVDSVGGVIYERKFNWDFSAQMNFLLDMARQEGYDSLFRIDPDECLFPEDVTEIFRLLRTGIDGLYVGRTNYVRDRYHFHEQPNINDEQLRGIRLDRGYRYQNAVHEIPNIPKDKLTYRHDIRVHHYSLISPPKDRTLRDINYRRISAGQPVLSQIPSGIIAGYPEHIPYTGKQPLDPSIIGKYAPFKEEDMTEANAIDKISTHDWYHSIEVAPGVVTKGAQNSQAVLAQMDALGLPQDMTGLRVLEVGAGDGFYAFAAERRGAEVVAIDKTRSKGWDIAHDLLDSNIELQVRNLYGLSVAKDGVFDIILFGGVIYHLRHPLMALDILRSLMKPGGKLFIETHLIDGVAFSNSDEVKTVKLSSNVPYTWQMVKSLNTDMSCTWFPSWTGLKSALEKSGFSVIKGEGKDRCVLVAEANADEWATYNAFFEFEGSDFNLFPVAERPHPRRQAPPSLVKFKHGVLDMWIREGAYNAVDKGVTEEVQQVYFRDKIDYASVKNAIDFGAHVGAFTQMVKVLSPQSEIHAIEPVDDNFELLQMNTAAYDGITLTHGVVAYGDEDWLIAAHDLNSGGGVAVPASKRAEAESDPHRMVYAVPEKVTLEQIIEQHGWDEVDIIKSDCEGAEHLIFNSCDDNTLKRTKYIVGEWHAENAADAEKRLFSRLREFFDVEYDVHPDKTRGCFFAKRKEGIVPALPAKKAVRKRKGA